MLDETSISSLNRGYSETLVQTIFFMVHHFKLLCGSLILKKASSALKCFVSCWIKSICRMGWNFHVYDCCMIAMPVIKV